VALPQTDVEARRYCARYDTSDLPDIAAALWRAAQRSEMPSTVAWLQWFAAVVESEFRRRSN